jgi:hypothetical protein
MLPLPRSDVFRRSDTRVLLAHIPEEANIAPAGNADLNEKKLPAAIFQ